MMTLIVPCGWLWLDFCRWLALATIFPEGPIFLLARTGWAWFFCSWIGEAGPDDTDDDDADEDDVVDEDDGNANDDGNVNATGNDLGCCWRGYNPDIIILYGIGAFFLVYAQLFSVFCVNLHPSSWVIYVFGWNVILRKKPPLKSVTVASRGHLWKRLIQRLV